MRQGYLPEELKYISLDKYKETIVDLNVTPEIIELRWKAMEERRKIKVENVTKERQIIIDEQNPPSNVKNSAPSKSRKKLEKHNSEDLDYKDKKLAKNKNENNKSASNFKAKESQTQLAIELMLEKEKQQLKDMKKSKRKMIDSFIKKVVEDEKDKKEKEEFLLKKREEAQKYIEENQK